MRRKAGAVIGAVALVAVAVVYYLFNPATSRLAPKCVFRLVTGYDCPRCGSQRLLHSLLHGDLYGAWQANAYLLCIAPLLLLMGFAAMWRSRYPRLYAAVNSLPVIAAVCVSLISWTIFRNL